MLLLTIQYHVTLLKVKLHSFPWQTIYLPSESQSVYFGWHAILMPSQSEQKIPQEIGSEPIWSKLVPLQWIQGFTWKFPEDAFSHFLWTWTLERLGLASLRMKPTHSIAEWREMAKPGPNDSILSPVSNPWIFCYTSQHILFLKLFGIISPFPCCQRRPTWHRDQLSCVYPIIPFLFLFSNSVC